MQKLDVVMLHSEFFKNHGFVLNQSQLFFEKVFSHGKQVVFVHFAEGSNENYLEYHLAIRIDAVEEMVQKYLPSPINRADQSITLALTADRLGSFYPKKITVTNKSELAKVTAQIEKFFIDKGFDWLDQMIDPINLEQAFLRQSTKQKQDFNLVESAFRATALSKLYNTEDYPILRQAFLEKIQSQQFTPFTIASFLQFLNHLDNLKLIAA
jgi:hypothetical protein